MSIGRLLPSEDELLPLELPKELLSAFADGKAPDLRVGDLGDQVGDEGED